MVMDNKKLVLEESVVVYKNTHNLLLHFMALVDSKDHGRYTFFILI